MKNFLVFVFVICFSAPRVRRQLATSGIVFKSLKWAHCSPFSFTVLTQAAREPPQKKPSSLLIRLTWSSATISPNSELNRLCLEAGSGRWVTVSPPLFAILQTAKQAAERSDGSFDVTVAPLSRLWRMARKEGHLPNPYSVRSARSVTGYRYMMIDTVGKKIKLLKKGMQLDLGGIAKGETAQRVIDLLKLSGYPYSMIDAGGDIALGDVPDSVPCWKIGINYPGADSILPKRLCISGMSVTTSGDLYQYLEVKRKKYSHIIDPRNGKALIHSRNVTVIAPRGVDADWLTKACSILSMKRSMKLVSEYPGVELQIAQLRNGSPVFYRSPGFEKWFEH